MSVIQMLSNVKCDILKRISIGMFVGAAIMAICKFIDTVILVASIYD